MGRPALSMTRAVAVRRVVLGIVGATACARPTPPGSGPAPAGADARVARVSLGLVATTTLSATGQWRLIDRDGGMVARGDSGAEVVVTAAQRTVWLTERGSAARLVTSPLVLVPTSGRAVSVVNGRRYRGQLSVGASDSGLRVVNHVEVEAYLRGVVPRELGVRSPGDRPALEAQAVAARSYAITRLGNASRAFDLTATTSDQVYGGVDAENAAADAAIAATEGLVLMYNGRVVSAPYHSTCGGSTAGPTELWRSGPEPFLQRVSDRIPGSERFYCDIAPRFRWERSWRADTLTAVVERYLRTYAQVPAGPVGAVRGVSVDGRTASGRIAAIVIETERGRYRVRANDVRYVLRSPSGELLNSTYFSPEAVPGS